MKKVIYVIFSFIFCFFISACAKNNVEKKLTMVFLPNESNESMKDAREAFKQIITAASGIPVEIKTTTDYNIALESIISGQADMAYIGAEGYITAHKKNNAIIPVAVNSGASGTLSDAKYYSFIAVRSENVMDYKTNDAFDLNNLRGKIISFVSPSSTSGFVIPGKFLVSQFGLESLDSLIQPKIFFDKVLFAGSHQGSEVNLFRKDADAAAFAIPQTIGVYDLISGEPYKTGAVYRVVEGADEPFGEFAGTEIVVVKSIPVLNAPIVINSDTVDSEIIRKIQAALTSSETAANPGIFKTEGSDKKGMYPRYNENTKLISVDDSWYDEIRDLTD